MHDHDDDEDYLDPDETLVEGDFILLWDKERGLEKGILTGVTDAGVLWRCTHRRVETEDSDGNPDWEFEELSKYRRVFSPWNSVERLESEDDLIEDMELTEFRDLMSSVNDLSDLEALIDAANEGSD